MKLLLAIIFLVVLVAVIVARARRPSGPDGYRRRFENRYRHDASDSSAAGGPMFVAGIGDSGSHHPHAHGHHSHGAMDCGVHGGHADGGAAGCGDGGAN